jgi:epoxyqueuosine reductase QueG
VQTISLPTPTVPPKRPRVSRWRIALAAASVVLLGIGFAALVFGRISESNAESARDAKREQVSSQRKSTAATAQAAQQRRAQATQVADAADAVLSLADQIAQNDAQLLSVGQDAVNHYADADPSAYNAAVDRGTALIARDGALKGQINAALDALRAKLAAFDQATTTS